VAGLIPKSFIDDLLLRVDIVDVIDTHVPLKKAGKDFKACCPFHDEKTPSFTVSSAKQFYHCFGCGAHGTAIGFLMEYEHLSFPEAVEVLAARAGLTVPHEAGVVSGGPRNDSGLLEILQDAMQFYRRQWHEHPQARQAVDYLKGRGITGEIAASFALGYAPEGWDNLTRALGRDDARREQLVQAGLAVKKEQGGYYDRFRSRIIFPIHDYRGRVVGFGGRAIGHDEPKYLNSPETPLFHKGRELYGLYRAREEIKRTERVLVVEGYMDVVALAQFGIEYAVATLGTATTRDHLERVFRYAPEIVFCFDGDAAGRTAARRALEQALPVLYEGRQIGFLFLPEGEDPDSLVRKEGRGTFEERVQQATPLPDFLFQGLIQQVDTARLDGRARLVELARPLVSKLSRGVFRQMMLDRLAALSQMNPEKLSTLIDSRPVPESPARGRKGMSGAPKEPPSAMRLAIALLVQYPELAAKAPVSVFFGDSNQPGAALLGAVLELLRSRPELKTGGVIEHFRDTEHQAALEKLAVWHHPVLEQDVASEFQGVLEQLRRAASRDQAERLLQKQRTHGLDTAEKAELARLLAEKRDFGGFPPGH
jgi:DNA primase